MKKYSYFFLLKLISAGLFAQNYESQIKVENSFKKIKGNLDNLDLNSPQTIQKPEKK